VTEKQLAKKDELKRQTVNMLWPRQFTHLMSPQPCLWNQMGRWGSRLLLYQLLWPMLVLLLQQGQQQKQEVARIPGYPIKYFAEK